MRERWFGGTGLRVPEILVEGEELEVVEEGRVRLGERDLRALVARELPEPRALREAYLRGTPILVRARAPQEVLAALERPEVAAVLVTPEHAELRELDLRRLKYG